MDIEEDVFARLEAIWYMYPSSEDWVYNQKDLYTGAEGSLVSTHISKVDPLVLKEQGPDFAIDYIDVPGDWFPDGDGGFEVFLPNSESIDQIIDSRPEKLAGMFAADIIFRVSRVLVLSNTLVMHQHLYVWRDSVTGEKSLASGYWVGENSIKPRLVRLYPEVLKRHTEAVTDFFEP